MTRDADVIVVGAGLAGLAAATVAARAGRRVVLLDARAGPGGRARTADRQGYLLNEGPHALYRDGEAMAVLHQLGVEPDGGVPPGAGSMGLRGDHLGLLPVGAASLARSDLVGVRGKVELGRLLLTLPRVRPDALATTNVGSWLTAALTDERARDIMAGLVRLTTYTNDPAHVSADAAVMQLQRAMAGNVLYLHGGWQQLVDGLRAAALAAGVDLRTGVKVERLVPGLGAVTAITTATSLEASSVVVAAGGARALSGLLEAPTAEVREWADAARPARAAVLDVAWRAGWGDAPGFVVGVDWPIYLSVHTRVARVAPPGAALVSVMKYLPGGRATDPDADRAELEAVLDRVRPGWRGDVSDVLFRPRLVASTDVPQAAHGGLAGRPGPEVPDAPGVLVAGDWVGPRGVLADAALASGVAAGERAAARRRISAAA